jgi:hypothetical protein
MADMTGETPRTNPEAITNRLWLYFLRTRFKLGDLGEDAATIKHGNGLTETVESDVDNTLGTLGERVSSDERYASAYALGLVVGAAMLRSGQELPEPYESLVKILSAGQNDG